MIEATFTLIGEVIWCLIKMWVGIWLVCSILDVKDDLRRIRETLEKDK